MPLTDAEKKANQRARERDQGLKRIEVLAREEQRFQVKAFERFLDSQWNGKNPRNFDDLMKSRTHPAQTDTQPV